jgi:arylsulfatase A-like enzyme
LAATQVLGQRASKPNVLVILFDDLGVQDLGYLGASDLKTPNIDKLAVGGTLCRNWYSNAPVCAPARAALMTGRCPIRAGVANNGSPLQPRERSVATILKETGYETALLGKWHLGSTAETVPNAHGFDYFYGFHEGCVDFYSHRYYWGEPARAKGVAAHGAAPRRILSCQITVDRRFERLAARKYRHRLNVTAGGVCARGLRFGKT